MQYSTAASQFFFQLRQGEFRTLAATDKALVNVFHQGLFSVPKDKLAVCEIPENLEEPIDVAIQR